MMVKLFIIVTFYVLHGAYVLSFNVFKKPKDQTANEPQYFLYQTSPGVWTNESLVGKPACLANDSDVSFYFINREAESGILIPPHSTALRNTPYNKSKRTFFLVFGWNNNIKSDFIVTVKKAYLTVDNVNLIIVDWSKISMMNYLTAQFNVKKIGTILSIFVKRLTSDGTLDLKRTTFVGHSLGAHVAGIAGCKLGGKVDQIIGLDPAGPLFAKFVPSNRIDSSCGKFVQIIHTNAGTLGLDNRLGHADYWPNGGKKQPGCGLDIDGHCAHSRAYLYFQESIVTGNFISKKCNYWSRYERGRCNKNKSSWMGGYYIDESAKGDFYLSTNDAYPYAKG